jgi:hypothetical protein
VFGIGLECEWAYEWSQGCERVSRKPPESRSASADAGVGLLPPRLQLLSGEKRAEAVALLSELLLAAAGTTDEIRDLPAVVERREVGRAA